LTGIEALEKQAKMVIDMFRATRIHMQFRNPIWTENQNIEMLTRVYVRKHLEELLGKQLLSVALQELEDVMFTLIYPTYAKKDEI
jgi:hypothetical protein